MTHYTRKLVSKARLFPGLGMGRVELRYDDRCGNGHDTFSITVDGGERFGGCMHDDIVAVFPEFADLVRFHLVSDDGPLHYVANTLFHAREGNLKYARSTAVAPNASLEELQDMDFLEANLDRVMSEFAVAMSGIVWDVVIKK